MDGARVSECVCRVFGLTHVLYVLWCFKSSLARYGFHCIGFCQVFLSKQSSMGLCIIFFLINIFSGSPANISKKKNT
jgi:hypothetical protein